MVNTLFTMILDIPAQSEPQDPMFSPKQISYTVQ
jgi:hypothetical protein